MVCTRRKVTNKNPHVCGENILALFSLASIHGTPPTIWGIVTEYIIFEEE